MIGKWIKIFWVFCLAMLFLFLLEGAMNYLSFNLSKHLSSSNYSGHLSIWILASSLSALIVAIPVALFLSPKATSVCFSIGVLWFFITKFILFRPYVNPDLETKQYIIGIFEAYGPKSIGMLLFIGTGLFFDKIYKHRKPNNRLKLT